MLLSRAAIQTDPVGPALDAAPRRIAAVMLAAVADDLGDAASFAARFVRATTDTGDVAFAERLLDTYSRLAVTRGADDARMAVSMLSSSQEPGVAAFGPRVSVDVVDALRQLSTTLPATGSPWTVGQAEKFRMGALQLEAVLDTWDARLLRRP